MDRYLRAFFMFVLGVTLVGCSTDSGGGGSKKKKEATTKTVTVSGVLSYPSYGTGSYFVNWDGIDDPSASGDEVEFAGDACTDYSIDVDEDVGLITVSANIDHGGGSGGVSDLGVVLVGTDDITLDHNFSVGGTSGAGDGTVCNPAELTLGEARNTFFAGQYGTNVYTFTSNGTDTTATLVSSDIPFDAVVFISTSTDFEDSGAWVYYLCDDLSDAGGTISCAIGDADFNPIPVDTQYFVKIDGVGTPSDEGETMPEFTVTVSQP